MQQVGYWVTFVLVLLLVGWFIGYIVYLAFRQSPERRAEESAREQFMRTGRWPDEGDTTP